MHLQQQGANAFSSQLSPSIFLIWILVVSEKKIILISCRLLFDIPKVSKQFVKYKMH